MNANTGSRSNCLWPRWLISTCIMLSAKIRQVGQIHLPIPPTVPQALNGAIDKPRHFDFKVLCEPSRPTAKYTSSNVSYGYNNLTELSSKRRVP